MPRRAVLLLVGLAAFAGVVFAITLWATLSGNAGQQRGLVIHSEIDDDVVVRLADGRSAELGPSGDRERAFVVKRDEYPSTIRVETPAGELLFEREFEYSYFADAEFRISFDTRGFYATGDLREPIRTPMSLGLTE